MEEWLKRLPPEEQLNQIMAELAVKTRGYQLNGVDSSLSGGGVAPGEVRISFIFGVEAPTDRQGEIIFGIHRDDLANLEYQSAEGKRSAVTFSEIRGDNELIGVLGTLVEGRRIETCNSRPLGETVRMSFWFDDGSKIRFNTRRGPNGVPRGRVMFKKFGSDGQRVAELPFPGTESRCFRSSATASAG